MVINWILFPFFGFSVVLGRWTGHSSVPFMQNCSSLSGKECIYEHGNEQVIEYLRLKGPIWGHQVKIPVQNKADFISSSHSALHWLERHFIPWGWRLFIVSLGCFSMCLTVKAIFHCVSGGISYTAAHNHCLFSVYVLQ